MDITATPSPKNEFRSDAAGPARKACIGGFDKLTLVTFVIALAGFAGSAFSAQAPGTQCALVVLQAK